MELSLQAPSFSKSIAKAILNSISWRVEVPPNIEDKFVLIGAHHTSGWDFFFTLLLIYATGIPLFWIGKDTLFRWPIAGVLRRLGGIPVNRRSSNNFVQQMVNVFNERDQFIMAISPEGTRGKSNYWKTGFYYIALGAKVPIALGFIDYPNKVVGIGPKLYPTGDLQADFVEIKNFYATITGRYPERQGEIKLRETGN